MTVKYIAREKNMIFVGTLQRMKKKKRNVRGLLSDSSIYGGDVLTKADYKPGLAIFLGYFGLIVQIQPRLL